MASSQWIWVTVIGWRNPQREKLEFSFGIEQSEIASNVFLGTFSKRKRAELRDVRDNSEEELYDAIHLDLEAH